MKSICIAVLVMGLILTLNVSADVPVRQVEIESKIVEVQQDDLEELGFSWTIAGGVVAPMDSDVKHKGSGGSGTAELSYDSGLLLESTIGYILNEAQRGCCLGFPTRIELGLSYFMYDWDTWRDGNFKADQSQNSTSFINLMANGFWDFNNNSRFTPFVMGGLGLSIAEIDYENKKHDETVLAAQAGAGVSFALSDSILLDATYRFHFSEDLEFKGGGVAYEIENQQHQLYFGARWKF